MTVATQLCNRRKTYEARVIPASGGGQYLNGLVWILQVMKDRGVNLTKEDIKWQPTDTTYGAKLAEDLNFQQLIDCAFEAVYGNGWTYNAANYQ